MNCSVYASLDIDVFLVPLLTFPRIQVNQYSYTTGDHIDYFSFIFGTQKVYGHIASIFASSMEKILWPRIEPPTTVFGLGYLSPNI